MLLLQFVVLLLRSKYNTKQLRVADFVWLLTTYGTPYSLSTGTRPNTQAMPMSSAIIVNQQVVEMITSHLSLGLNRPLLGLKCEPVLPGLLYHWNIQSPREIQFCFQLKMQIHVVYCRITGESYEVDRESQKREWY
jgi:hypothetical protein